MAVISASSRSPEKDRIDPLPFVTMPETVAASSAAPSRTGPTAPVVPAAASVWQPPQLSTKRACPSAAGASPPSSAAGSFAAGAARRRVGPACLRRERTGLAGNAICNLVSDRAAGKARIGEGIGARDRGRAVAGAGPVNASEDTRGSAVGAEPRRQSLPNCPSRTGVTALCGSASCASPLGCVPFSA